MHEFAVGMKRASLTSFGESRGNFVIYASIEIQAKST